MDSRGGQHDESYCGKEIIGPVPTGGWVDAAKYHTGQHCIVCDAAYRIVNSAVAVTYDF